jgi:hypothetical protein
MKVGKKINPLCIFVEPIKAYTDAIFRSSDIYHKFVPMKRVANRPRISHECPNLRPPNSFIREKFVDGFDRFNPAGLGKNSKTTRALPAAPWWAKSTRISSFPVYVQGFPVESDRVFLRQI